MGTSREGKVTQRTPFSAAAQRETRASRCCYQVYFISLCWHKKEVIELFFRFLRHDISRRRNRPLVAASEFRFLSPNLRNVQEEKYTILSRISYTTHFRNDLLLLLCMSCFSLSSTTAHRLHVYTRGSVSVNQQSWNHCELVNHPESRRRRWGSLLMSSWSDRSHQRQNTRPHR